MPIQIEGVQATIKAQRKFKLRTEKSLADGIIQSCNIILAASQKLVPVDTGELKASGHVEVTGKGLATEGKVIYDAPHSFVVHECLTHQHEPPTQARYLADAIPRVRGTITNLLKRQITAGVRGIT